ncbi:MAG: xanthine dehydrogenase family protein molybdopterin-binding subunit [Terracidiphilus sp.]|jgi:CO/xanthine dehydrogenase Mo-binding subunit
MADTPQESAMKAESEKPRPYGTGYRLIGRDYATPDMVAKVTGRSKYAEDFRAEGMLFCRLVLSPMPHARIRHIDASEAFAMPGVKAVLTADDIPPQADFLADNGQTIKANKWGERALTNEPMFQGDPILAVAAVDELTCAEAIEKIRIDMDPLPFVVDPLDSLRPGGPNPHPDGNVWVRGISGQQITELKWTKDDFVEYDQGRLPMGKSTGDWSYGDLDAGFRNAALVLDESFVTPDVSHQCLEPRTAMACWQNGKLYLHTGTQSTFQTVPAIARWMNLKDDQVVLVSEYTGGGFGSKVTGSVIMIIPAILSRKLNAPVMMRISREEEHYIGRARPGVLGRAKIGFARDGRITALDYYTVTNSGGYDNQDDGASSSRIVSLLYQVPAMRWRGLSVMTNTPTRSAQSAPGGMQGITIIEPILAKAARKLGVDQVAIRRVNCPEGKAEYGPPSHGQRAHVTSCFLRQALDQGAEQFKWQERAARPKRMGAKARGVGVSLSTFHGGTIGFDGLVVITPEGRVRFHSGIGNLGTESVMDVHRAGAEVLGVPWEICDVVWGDTSRIFPYTCASGGSQTTHAMTRAAFAVATECKQKLKEVAAKSLGGKPEDYDVDNARVFRKGGGAGMSLAQAAHKAIELGGIYDGHDAPDDVHKVTKAAVMALAGQGLVVAARDKAPRDGDTFSYVASFAEVEVDVETGKYYITDFLAYGDVGTVLHPHSLGGQLLGRSTLGIAHAIGQKWVYDPEYGVAVAKRFYQNKPPTILDVPVDMQWAALNIPDPETPVGARGVGEPPVGGGCAAILNALSDAVGDEIFQRAPVNADTILASFEAGRPMQHPLAGSI